jgi:hypothetical protein
MEATSHPHQIALVASRKKRRTLQESNKSNWRQREQATIRRLTERYGPCLIFLVGNPRPASRS